MNIKIKFILFLLGSSLQGYTQTGKITGKIILQDIENKNTVIKNTFVILKSSTISDSNKIASDLSFKFENLPPDTFYISFSSPSYPYDTRYVFYLKESEDKKMNINYSSTCPYDKTKDGICPVCKKKDKVIPIQYGLIAGKIDNNRKASKRKYYPGGCIVSDCQASWFCERDQKEF